MTSPSILRRLRPLASGKEEEDMENYRSGRDDDSDDDDDYWVFHSLIIIIIDLTVMVMPFWGVCA